VVKLVDLDPVEHAEEIEVPPRAAELAVGCELEADLLLLAHDLLDLAVLDLLELRIGDRALLVLGACVLERSGAQEAADMVGAERRLGAGACFRCGHCCHCRSPRTPGTNDLRPYYHVFLGRARGAVNHKWRGT